MKTRTFLKYIALAFYLPILLVSINSCQDEDMEKGVDFRIIKTILNESPVEVKGSIELSSADFEFTVTRDWCKVSKEGNMLYIQVAENYDYRNRSTEIVISSGQKTYRVPVTQTGILFEFTKDNFSYLPYGWVGGEYLIRILSNVEYSYSIPEEDKDWIEVEELGGGEFNIVVKESTANRRSEVTFQYLGKTLKTSINQYKYLSYDELLGPATMIYTNSVGDTIETEVIFEEKVFNQEFYLKGVFESGIERRIPLKYVEMENGVKKDGELRFHPGVLEANFTDPALSDKIKALSLFIFGDRTQKGQSPQDWYYTGTKTYIPAPFKVSEEGSFYKFSHSEVGLPNAGFFTYYAKGIVVMGSTSTGGTVSVPPYDMMLDIRIIKKNE